MNFVSYIFVIICALRYVRCLAVLETSKNMEEPDKNIV